MNIRLTCIGTCLFFLLIFSNMVVSGQEIVQSGSTDNVYISQTHGLKMNLPAGWQTLGKGKMEDWYNATLDGVPGLMCMASETLEENTPYLMLKFDVLMHDYTMDEYAEFLRKQNLSLREQGSGIEYIDDAQITNVGNKQGVKTHVHREGQDVIYYHFLRGGIAYTFIGVAPVSRVAEYAKIFDQTVASLEFDQDRKMAAEDLTAEDLARWTTFYNRQRSYDQAIIAGGQALSKNPIGDVKAEILYQLSVASGQKGSPTYGVSRDDQLYQKSLEFGQQCLAIKPDHWQAMVNMARVYMSMDQLEEADRYFTEAEKYHAFPPDVQGNFISEHGAVRAALSIRKELAKKNN